MYTTSIQRNKAKQQVFIDIGFSGGFDAVVARYFIPTT